MKDLTKGKLGIIGTVMLTFTTLNLIHDNDWIGYLFSLVILPLITWGAVEFSLYMQKEY